MRTGGQRTSSFNETDFLIENKFTDKPYYILKKDIWEKIKSEAVQDNFRIPLMQIDILDDLELVAMDLNDYRGFKLEEYMEVLEESHDIYKKSFRLEHDRITELDKEAYEQMRTLVISINMEVGKPERLVIMKKEDFIHVWEKVEK